MMDWSNERKEKHEEEQENLQQSRFNLNYLKLSIIFFMLAIVVLVVFFITLKEIYFLAIYFAVLAIMSLVFVFIPFRKLVKSKFMFWLAFAFCTISLVMLGVMYITPYYDDPVYLGILSGAGILCLTFFAFSLIKKSVHST